MMNGEEPSVPIISLSGMQSLTDLLFELPLPAPLPCVTRNQSLLTDLDGSKEAYQFLNTQESILIPQLIDALSCTAIEHIEIKDGYYEGGSHNEKVSQLVQCLLGEKPDFLKGLIHGPQNSFEDHHVLSEKPLEKVCSNVPVHSQPHIFSASAVSLHQPCEMQDNSPSCYPLEHPSISQCTKTVQNVPLKFSESHPPSTQQQSIPSLHGAVSAASVGSLASCLQESSQNFSSSMITTHTVNVSHLPSVNHPFSNSNCIVSDQNSNSKPNDETRNHVPNSVHPMNNISPNCSPFTSFLNNDISESPSSQFTNSSSDVLGTSSFADSFMQKPVEYQQSVSSNSFDISQNKISAKENVSNTCDSKVEPLVQPLTVLGSEPNKESELITEQEENNDKNENSLKPLAMSGKRLPVTQPCIVLLKKPRLQDHLDQNHVEKFSSSDTSPEFVKIPVQNEISGDFHQTCKNQDLSNESTPCENPNSDKNESTLKLAITPGKISVTEPIVLLTKLSLEDQVLAQNSIQQFMKKNKKVDSSELVQNESSDDDFQPDFGKKSILHRKSSKDSKLIRNRGSKRKFPTSPEKLSNNNKPTDQRRKSQHILPQTNCNKSPVSNSDGEESPMEIMPSTSKTKKIKSKKVKKDLASKSLSVEDLMDSNTYHHFSCIVDNIFDSVEDVDFSVINKEDAEYTAEALIPLTQLQDLRNEAAKLKRLHATSHFPPERLVRLLAILERNIVDGAQLLPVQSMEEQDEEEARLWLELTIERVMRSADASLTVLYILTSPKMPEKVFLEDVIERIVLFLKYQLQNTIFPIFDPAYRFDPKSKDGYAGNIKQKRAHTHKTKDKSILQLYNKLHEAVSLLAELLELQTVTDTIILQVSTLGVSPFFVEEVNELQLSALHLVTTVFAQYDKHRKLILEDILASIARLPTSKRSLRNYRLNSETNIQMLTALILQLIHSVVSLPETVNNPKLECSPNEGKSRTLEIKDKVCADQDDLIITSFDAAMRTAVNFLTVFLKKCGTKNEEMDYRPLFENFVRDLLSTVNKPEWPASELLLSLLGRILVQNFSNKSMEMALRVASLDYLGVVAARLRKDAITSQDHKSMINDVIQRIMTESDDADLNLTKSKSKNTEKSVKCDEIQILHKALLQYLDTNASNDPTLQFSRRFYIAQWYKDASLEIKHSVKSLSKDDTEKSDPLIKNKQNPLRNSCRKLSQVNSENKKNDEELEESESENDETNAKIVALAEERKQFLLSMIKQQKPSKVNMKKVEHIDYETAELISQYLASGRHFSKSFDLYLSQILRVLNETAVAVRTKAMKCLSLVVEADPSILSRPDIQKGVYGRFLDHSTSVREAAVDLLGKFILIRPELINQYYEMLTARILDTGVSVRKRVIKILKDVCLEQPDFPRVPEICVKMIRRVNDEDGIRKLVGEVFQSMWFNPVSEKKQQVILQKVKNITHVVEACKDVGLEWFEQLLTNLLKNKEDSNYKSVIKSCKQIVDCLVENLLQLEESSENIDGGASPHLVACLMTLHLFSKIYPPFVVPHATVIQPYLSMKCNTQSDFLLLKNVALILELIVPLIEHPSESFLAQIEEDLVKLILRQHMGLLPSCVNCLGTVINKVTHNYQLVKDSFQKIFVVLLVCKTEYEKNPENEILKSMKPKLLRSLYTVGLFCRHFDFDVLDTGLEQNAQISFKDRVFESIIYFIEQENEGIKLKALIGLGFMMIKHYEFMLGPEVKTLYHYFLTSPVASSMLKCQVLKNIASYLVEEELKMIQKDAEWSKTSKSEDLKEMGDVTSGMASTIIQVYLKQILECVLYNDISVRKACLSVIQLILGQGLVHPVQIVPYLVCLSSDDDPVIRTKADQLLQDIEKKYPGFIQMKAIFGVRLSYKMQQLIQNPNEILRGFRCPKTPVSRTGFLYSVIRSTRQSRRAFLRSLLKLFDEQVQTPLKELLYIADNIVYFPYLVQDEPLFVIHHLDIMLSISGSNLLQTFHEALFIKQASEANEQNMEVDDDDEDDFTTILEQLPNDMTVLQECIIASQGCTLLLYIKQTLKEMYGFTDNKIQQYSPSEAAKVYERPLNRKGHVRFNPETVLNFIETRDVECELNDQGKQELVSQYLHFKQLMLTIDPSDDDEEDGQIKPVVSTLTATHVTNLPENAISCENNNEIKPVQHHFEKTKSVISRKIKTPSHSSSASRKLSKTPKEKGKKKHKKKKKSLNLLSDDSGSDPDYVDFS